MSETFLSGFVGIVGPTNSGKSTLTNALVGEKVSITSPLPQTTYHSIRGIVNGPNFQAVLTDTPGFQKQGDTIPRLLNKVADQSAKDCDLLIWVFDASHSRMMGQILKLKSKISQLKPKEKSFLVLNKVDRVAKPDLLPLLQELSALDVFQEIIPISAKKKDGLPSIMKIILDNLPEGPAMYPRDSFTDRKQNFLISEFIREKIYRTTREEIPYCARVEIEEWSDVNSPEGNEGDRAAKEKVPTVRAIIHVDSDSRKGILIGKMGHQLKEIGTKAREDIEKMLGHQICLKLFVSLDREWRKDANGLNKYLELS
jgi:GTP-binding protein Era